MKRKLFILIFSGMTCSIVSAQTVFYNRGAVVTKSTDKTKAIVYIKGSMQAGSNAASVTTSQIAVQQSKVILTGDLINDVTRGSTGGTLFVPLSATQAGTLEFRGMGNAQKITTSGTTNTTIPSKLENFINFPHLEVNNSKHVSMDAQLAAKTRDIDLKKGWLILDSKTADPNVDGATADADNQSVLAHLLVEGQVDYHSGDWSSIADPNERGFIQVNIKVPSEGDRNAKSIVGFGSPFKEIRNDYFMFNTILAPSPAGFVGAVPITNPEVVLKAGKGYVMGIDLRGKNGAAYDEPPYNPTIDFNQRAHEGHYFNRHLFATDPKRSANQIFGMNTGVDAYQNELLTTENITIQLSKGFNYLSNPFTCPLNIEDLLGNNEAATNWGIHSDALAAKPQMFNSVWVLSPNSVAEPSASGNPKQSKYTYNYQVAKRTGGTYTDEDNVAGVTAIAPLQLFLINAYSTANTITIPKNQRVMGTSRFIRSTANREARKDDFILEFRDETTRTTDRVSFVLREENEIASNANYKNVNRLESTSSESNNASRSEAVTATGFKQSLASQIYTKDASGQALTVQFLPIETTSSVILYHTPSTVAQDITIRGLRINTMDKIKEMWLEDKVQTAYMEITSDLIYETSSKPNDREDRFVIHFKTASGIDDIEQTQKIYAYDSNGTIWVEGFQNSDIGNKVQLIDLHGRVLTTRTVNELKMNLSDSHMEGAYIIRMSGSRLQTIKLLTR